MQTEELLFDNMVGENQQNASRSPLEHIGLHLMLQILLVWRPYEQHPDWNSRVCGYQHQELHCLVISRRPSTGSCALLRCRAPLEFLECQISIDWLAASTRTTLQCSTALHHLQRQRRTVKVLVSGCHVNTPSSRCINECTRPCKAKAAQNPDSEALLARNSELYCPSTKRSQRRRR